MTSIFVMTHSTDCYICRAPRWNGDTELFIPAAVVKESEYIITATGVDCDIIKNFNKNKVGDVYANPRCNLGTALEECVDSSDTYKYYLTFNLQYVRNRIIDIHHNKSRLVQADLYDAIKSFPDRFISAGVSEKSTVFNYLIQLINSLPESEK